MPETKEFRGWYPPAVRAEVDHYLHELSVAYEAPLIGARDRIAVADFGDPYHLLPRGAAAITRRFGEEALLRFLPDEPVGQDGTK